MFGNGVHHFRNAKDGFGNAKDGLGRPGMGLLKELLYHYHSLTLHQQKWLNLAGPGKAWEKCVILVRLARPCKAWAGSQHLYQIWPECATPMLGLSRK